MKILVKKIKMENFKAVKFQEISLSENVLIYGKNEVGKSTIIDAYTWCLFGKDSLERDSGKDIKTLDEFNNIIPGLETKVVLTLEINNKEKVIERIFKEVWKTPRGQAEKVFSGYTTDYYIDDVSLKESEFKKEIEEIINESDLKLLSNPIYFNEILHWKDRRKILLSEFGDIEDKIVLESNGQLKELEEELQNKDIDKLRKSLAGKIKRLKDDKKSLPVRIDEVSKNIKEIDISDLEQEIKEYKEKKSQLQEELSNINLKFKDVSEKELCVLKTQSEISKIDLKIEKLKHNSENKANEPFENKKIEISKLENKINNLEFDLSSKKDTIAEYEKHITKAEALDKELIDDYINLKKSEIDFSKIETTCPYCGQGLPQEKLEETREKMKNTQEEIRNNKMKDIVSAGKENKSNLDKYLSKLGELKNVLPNIDAELKNSKSNLELLQNELNNLNKVDPEEFLKNSVEYIELCSEKSQLEKTLEIEKLSLNNAKNNTDEEAKQEIFKKIKITDDMINQIVNQIENNKNSKERVNELMQEERKISNKIAELEKLQYKTELFIRSKVELLEQRINSKFEKVEFKLFNQLQNGGLEETCEVTVDGVPYKIVNNGNKLLSGLDIINTLSKSKNIYLPVFFDNSESMTHEFDIDTQFIKTKVTNDDKLNIIGGTINE